MRAHSIIVLVCVFAAVFSVRHLDGRAPSASAPENAPSALSMNGSANKAVLAPAAYQSMAGEVRIKASKDHQFYVEADVNRRAARFLVDTGASHVALRDSDARAAGVYTSWTDYQYPVRTANGETKAAFVTLDAIEISGIRIEGVKAFILQDDQLTVNLLGMSFLSRLESVEARSGELVLRG